MATVVFQRPKSLKNVVTHYCPGCPHGIAHRLVAEAIDKLGIRDVTIGVASVGCSVLAYNYFDCDFVQAAHGRAPAVATGLKRVLPDRVVFTYQGDGDLAAIGTAEIVHAAARGENITVVFVNNGIYGMTGGQMAPTTLIGERTTTSPSGREPSQAGYPIRVCEMLATLDGAYYVARASLHDPANVLKAGKYVLKAFQCQVENKGFSIVELLSACPTNWGMKPSEALEFVKTRMVPFFPLGEFKGGSKGEA